MKGEPHFLAFETGGTKLVAGIAGRDARLSRTSVVRRQKEDKAGESFRKIVDVADRLLADERIGSGQLHAIGFGFGGTVQRSSNRPDRCLHEEGWEDLDVAAELELRFQVPVHVENDCKLAALAEAHFGAGMGARSVFYITLGTGVGGGFVLDGQILALGDLGEAEIGHVVVDPDGPECCCGNRGCVEALCSGPGLSNFCRVLAERHPSEWNRSTLAEAAHGGTQIGSERIVRSWEAGDRFAERVVVQALQGLAVALAATINLLVPERVVVGGGLGTSSPRLLGLLGELTYPMVVPYFRHKYSLVASTLREDAVTQGAAILASQRAGQSHS